MKKIHQDRFISSNNSCNWNPRSATFYTTHGVPVELGSLALQIYTLWKHFFSSNIIKHSDSLSYKKRQTYLKLLRITYKHQSLDGITSLRLPIFFFSNPIFMLTDHQGKRAGCQQWCVPRCVRVRKIPTSWNIGYDLHVNITKTI